MRKDEFARRRRQLMKMMGKGGIAILPAVPEKARNSDVHYHYRPDSDFFYLTGFAEPEAVAVLIPGRAQAEYVLFVRDRDPTRETWDGRRAGPEGATRDYGADDAFPIGDIDDILPGLMENCSRVYYTMGLHQEFDQRVIGWVNGLKAQCAQRRAAAAGVRRARSPAARHAPVQVAPGTGRDAPVGPHRRRARTSARCASRGPGRKEYEVMAELLHEFRRNNADISYHPIVGGGANACILHYHENSETLQDGDLLLIDAGCEYELYASDITRTFPVNGRFTPEQRAIYEVVLDAQHAAIDKTQPGQSLERAARRRGASAITQGLVKLGILKGKVPALIKDGAYRRFFMHRTGHWLGMDVHDVGDYKIGEQWRVLEPGMALTVEPGIYIPAGSRRACAKRWWNIGVRIEDDVAVTGAGNEVLTAGAAERSRMPSRS